VQAARSYSTYLGLVIGISVKMAVAVAVAVAVAHGSIVRLNLLMAYVGDVTVVSLLPVFLSAFLLLYMDKATPTYAIA
jgi:hypothetical protein